MKKQLLLIFVIFTVISVKAQEVSIEIINNYENPKHRDDIGNWALGDTLFVKGSYTKETAKKVKLRLLTFAEGTWSNTLDIEEVIVADANYFSGDLDSFLVIPLDYLLKIESGSEANTQILQVNVEFDGFDTNIHNFYLNIVDKTEGSQSSIIDFDAIYGFSTGNTLANNITNAINTSKEGDTIMFKSAEYDFQGKKFTINKGVNLTGVISVKPVEEVVGAYEVTTTFKNLKSISMTSSNFSIENLKIVSIEESSYVFTRFSHPNYNTDKEAVFYTNCRIKNVIYVGGGVQVFGENSAGVTFENVSFLDYKNGGYYCNRKNKVDNSPKVIVKNCKFAPNLSTINYNVRGISIDAGNDEYPEVWGQNGFLIDGCLFDGQGLGFSKGKNIIITNNHFIGYRKDVDMIHMEEYTNNIHIENNTFEFNKPSRCFFVDREAQPAHDITIINNTFKGKYHWIFWSNGPYNLTFENNDFTQASANDPDYITFDFSHDDGAEPLPYPLPIENVIIRNNAGLNNGNQGILSYDILKEDTSNIIEGFSNEFINKNTVETNPLPIIEVDKHYRIRNKFSGEYVAAQNGDTKTKLISEMLKDSSDVWLVKFRYPYTYTFLNAKTKQYLEVDKGYTLHELTEIDLDPVYVEQKNKYLDIELKPHFFLRKLNENTFQIAPGGNERKTRLVKNGDLFKIDVAIKNGGFLAPSNESVWQFIEVASEEIKSDNFSIQVFSETCPSQNNGRIVISAELYQDYIIQLNGSEKGTFKEQIVLEGLAPAEYDLCISVPEKNMGQCFKLKIEATNSVSGKVTAFSNKVIIDIIEGTPPFTVQVNGNVVQKTFLKEIDLDVVSGDFIEVSTSIKCEGLLKNKVEFNDAIRMFPNPVIDYFQISEVNADSEFLIFDLQGRILLEGIYKGEDINVSFLNAGIYIFEINNEKLKFIKI